MHPLEHAASSARLFGGEPEEYLPIHRWFDASKAHLADFRHRALRHHTQGIFDAEQVFGIVLKLKCGKEIPVRVIGEQHVKEDCGGKIPTLADWFREIKAEVWMTKNFKLE